MRPNLRDPLIRNSLLMMVTALMGAFAGSLFWVIAARLGTRSQVGLASSLATGADALAIFAQLGLNISLLRTMPRSDRRGSDVLIGCGIVAAAGGLFGLGYAGLLPSVAPDLARVVSSPLTVAVFAIFVAGGAVNQLTDGIFLAIDRLLTNLYVNGVVISVLKLALPFALVGIGAFATFGVVGSATLVAAVISLVLIFRHLPDRPSLRPSAAFRAARGFAGAGYLSNVLYITPQLVIPILIINGQGPAASGSYFLSFQIVTLVNHGVYTIASSALVEASRAPARAAEIVARAGRTIAAVAAVLITGAVLAAPLLLQIFGSSYADAASTLRILALGTVGVGFNLWSATRLRIAHHLRAMVGVQLFTTALMVLLAAVAAQYGITYVAASWGVGQLAGGILGYLVSRKHGPLGALAFERPKPFPRVATTPASATPVSATPVAAVVRPQPRPRPRPRPFVLEAKDTVVEAKDTVVENADTVVEAADAFAAEARPVRPLPHRREDALPQRVPTNPLPHPRGLVYRAAEAS